MIRASNISSFIRTFRLGLPLSIFLMVVSCDSVLDIEADGTVSGNIYTNQSQIEDALVGAYYNFAGINDGSVGGELMGGDFILIPTLLSRRNNNEISWDDVNGPQYSNFMDKQILTINPRVEANWRRSYEVINLLNSILANIDNVSDATVKNRIQGEALAMRAILYFEMVRLWGRQYSDLVLDVETIPLRTEPLTEVDQIVTPTLATIGEIYDQVEMDFLEASTLLEGFGTNGVNISYYACQAYLMRLYMQKRDYASAQAFADNIINSNQFQLAGSPMETFNNVSNSAEDIFAIQQSASSNAGDRSTGSGLPNFYSSVTESGIGVMRIFELPLVLSSANNGPQYSAADLRGVIDTNVDENTTADQINGMFYTNILNTALLSSAKYLRSDRVIPIIRLAEIHLSRAEILYEEDINLINPVALGDLNIVRNRAGLPSLLETDFFNSFAFYDSLILERKRELIYEGILFHDLKRWEEKVGFTTVTSPNFILPLPQAETDTWTD